MNVTLTMEQFKAIQSALAQANTLVDEICQTHTLGNRVATQMKEKAEKAKESQREADEVIGEITNQLTANIR